MIGTLTAVDDSKIGALLQFYRKANGLTQERFVEIVGGTASHLSRMEQGTRPVTYDLIQRLRELRSTLSKGDLDGLEKAFETALQAKALRQKPRKVSILSLLEETDSQLSSNYEALILTELPSTSVKPWLMFEKLLEKLQTSLLHPAFFDPAFKISPKHLQGVSRYISKWHAFCLSLHDSKFEKIVEEGSHWSDERNVARSVGLLFDGILDLLQSRMPELKSEFEWLFLERSPLDEPSDKPEPPSGWKTAPSGRGAETSTDELEIDEIPF